MMTFVVYIYIYIYFIRKVCSLPIAFEVATTEHAGGSGVPLSVGAMKKAYVD